MSDIKRIQHFVLRGKTIEKLLDEKHGEYESNWFCDDDGTVRFVSNPMPLYKDLPFQSMHIYKWKISNDQIIACNINAMKLTPELSAIMFSIRDGRGE